MTIMITSIIRHTQYNNKNHELKNILVIILEGFMYDLQHWATTNTNQHYVDFLIKYVISIFNWKKTTLFYIEILEK